MPFAARLSPRTIGITIGAASITAARCSALMLIAQASAGRSITSPASAAGHV